MPKHRALDPDGVYSRRALEDWLQNNLYAKTSHRHRIWKHLSSNTSIHDVPDIPKGVKDKFDAKFVLTTSRVVERKTCEHGRKLVIQLQDGHLIETVIIKHTPKRSTVCVSSQVGCQMGCTFCATGLMGKIGNLLDVEIVEQVHHARQEDSNVTGVVFMGMGEPLDNYTNVMEAIKSLSDHSIFNEHPIPLRRITLSTVGVVHGILKLSQECPQIQLALSLHAPNDEIRQQIVPTTKAFSISKIMSAVDKYQQAAGRSVMIEYIMIKDVNSSVACAHELGRLLQGRKCMVNLIPYNPTQAGDRYDFVAPPDIVLEEFAKVLYEYRDDRDKPLHCSIRWSSRRGQDIDAACGQLALKNIQCCSPASNGAGSSNDIEDIGGTAKRRGSVSGIANNRSSSRKEKGQYVDNEKSPRISAPISNHWKLIVISGAAAVVVGGAGMLLLRGRKSCR